MTVCDRIHSENSAWNWEPHEVHCSSLSICASSGKHLIGTTKMSIQARSHSDLFTARKSSVDDSLNKSFSVSSSSINRRGHAGYGVTEEIKVLPWTSRRPVRAVQPVRAVPSGGSFLQVNLLQGELVRKRKVRTKKTVQWTKVTTLKLENWVFIKLGSNDNFWTFVELKNSFGAFKCTRSLVLLLPCKNTR